MYKVPQIQVIRLYLEVSLFILTLPLIDDLRDGQVLQERVARAKNIPVEERTRRAAIPIDKGMHIADKEVNNNPSQNGVNESRLLPIIAE